MKKYEKPIAQISELLNGESIATNLGEWLYANSVDSVNITTYCMNS